MSDRDPNFDDVAFVYVEGKEDGDAIPFLSLEDIRCYSPDETRPHRT